MIISKRKIHGFIKLINNKVKKWLPIWQPFFIISIDYSASSAAAASALARSSSMGTAVPSGTSSS